MDKKCSYKYPYKLIKIVDILSKGNFSKLYIGIAPGKKDVIWDRDLDIIRNNDINIIICLLDHKELYNLNLIGYEEKVRKYNIIFYHFPIKDEVVQIMSILNLYQCVYYLVIIF